MSEFVCYVEHVSDELVEPVTNTFPYKPGLCAAKCFDEYSGLS